MLEEYKKNIMNIISKLKNDIEEGVTTTYINEELDKIVKQVYLNDLEEEADNIFRYTIVNSYEKENWRKAIQDGKILDIIYLSRYTELKEKFFIQNIHNLDDVLYVLKRVLEQIEQEEKELEE